MRLPLSWLKTYLPKLPATGKLVESLLMHGLDVEQVIDGSDTFANVVVGEITAIRPHPNADKLRLVDVLISSDRSSSARQEIVCGAPNIEVGQKVPVALLGAVLPNGLTIAKRAIRGVESNGMLCALDELGLGQDHSGIMVLDPKLKIGTPLSSALGADETVIDLTTPANRADLMAIRGLAWEIGAMLGKKAVLPTPKLVEGPTAVSAKVKVADARGCSLLTARVIRGVTLRPTPVWMVNRLRSAGMRSVNIIADVTNYIMLDYGQPLHAYDATKVHDQTLIARFATAGEQLKTLDGKVRTLDPDMLVIADAKRAIGLAGVMGGEETEVTSATTDIILEAAIFDPVSIRKTSRKLGLLSEASKRFEKGLWSSLSERASTTAAALIVELCGGTVEQGSARAGSAETAIRTVTMDPAYIAERLGMKIAAAKSKTVLTKLGFAVKGTAKAWKVSVPEWRLDVALPEDIVDEVGRMVGYELLPKSMPDGQQTAKELPAALRFKEEVRNILVDMGFTEVISHAFYSARDGESVKGDHFEIANPLDVNQQKLRKSLLPVLSKTLKRQADAGQDAAIFEIGYVFDPDRPSPVDRQQMWKLALGTAHKGTATLQTTIDALQKRLVTTSGPSGLRLEGPTRGRVVEFCEFDLRELMTASKVTFGLWDPDKHVARDVTLKEQSKYPPITRDIAFWWPKDEAAIHSTLTDLGGGLLKSCTITDRFQKDGRTSYKVSFLYQSAERTLTKSEVDNLEQKVKDALVKQGATIR